MAPRGPPPPYPRTRRARQEQRRPHGGAPRRRLSVRLVTVAGVEIRVHATFLALVALVALGSTVPDGPGLFAGLAWLVALFSCVVAHELAHSLVARRNGIPVIEIELLPIGGVSKMARLPDDPQVELRIAAAGPAASVALGAAFASLAVLVGASLWPPTLYGGAWLARLAWVNVILAAFNLLPALPLDGGRVLRAVLEQRSDREQATRTAARVGRFFASLMIAAGVLVNLWLLIIGVFVYLGSVAEEAAATLHGLTKDLRVRDVMIREPIVIVAGTPAGDAAASVWRGAQREFPVVTADGICVGLVTAGMLLDADPATPVGEIADTTAPVLSPDDPLEESGLLDRLPLAAPVVVGGAVVGLARSADAALVIEGLATQRGQRHP
jgi:Zn-dependent protease